MTEKKQKNTSKRKKLPKADSKEDIQRVRNIASHMLKRLEEGMTGTNFITPKDDNNLWGKKDNAISILSKLSKILVELSPDLEEPEPLDEDEISSEDIEILQRFIERNMQNIKKPGAKTLTIS